MQRRYNGSAWIDPTFNRRWNGSAWQDCEFLRRWNGSAWQDIWTGKYFTPAGVVGSLSTSSVVNGVWVAHAGGVGPFPGALLYLVPNQFELPLTLEIDWQYSANGNSAAYVGAFDNSATLQSGKTFSTHIRQSDSILVAQNSNAVQLGILFNINPDHGGVSADVTVYSIRINGENIPIK